MKRSGLIVILIVFGILNFSSVPAQDLSSGDTGVTRAKVKESEGGFFYHMGQFISPDTDRHCKAVIDSKYLLSNQELIECFHPDFLGGQFLDQDKVMGNDLGEFRQNLELWLYFVNASELIMANAKRDLEGTKALYEDVKRLKNDNPDFVNIESQYSLLATAKKQLNVYDYLQKKCKKKTLPLCAELQKEGHQAMIENLQFTVQTIMAQNPLFMHKELHKEMEKFSKLKSEEESVLEAAKSIDDEKLFKVFDKNSIEKAFKRNIPLALRAKIQSLQETMARHTPILENKIAFGDVNKVMSDARIMIDYNSANYKPGDMHIKVGNQLKAVNLNYASCKIWLQQDVNKLRDIKGQMAFDAAIIVASFGAGSVAAGVIKGIKSAKNVKTVSDVAASALKGNEILLAAVDGSKIAVEVDKCEKILNQALSMTSMSEDFKKSHEECLSTVNHQVLSLGLTAVGAGIGAKLSKLDIIAGRVARVEKDHTRYFSKMKETLKASRAATVVGDDGAIELNDTFFRKHEHLKQYFEKNSTGDYEFKLSKLLSEGDVKTLTKEYAFILKDLSGKALEYAMGIIHLLGQSLKKQNPELTPEQVKQSVEAELNGIKKQCQI